MKMGNVPKLVRGVLEDQKIQKWPCEVKASSHVPPSLKSADGSLKL